MNKQRFAIAISVVLIVLLVISGIAFGIAKTDHPGKYIFDVSLVVGATDWLSFFGSIAAAILGAIVAIVGVWWTLADNRKQYHQDQVNQSLPYFALRFFHHKSNYNPFACFSFDEEVLTPEHSLFQPQSEEDIKYQEYLQNNVCLVLANGKQEWKTDFSEKQWKLIKREGFYEKREGDKSYTLCQSNLVYTPIEFENVGRGAAVFIKVGVNRRDSKHGYVNIPARTVGERFTIRILSTNCTDAEVGDYDLDVVYFDIFQTVYRQRFAFSIVKSEESRYGCSISYNSKQEKFDSWEQMIKSES